MKANKVISILELRLKKLQKHLFKFIEAYDPEELHGYRLEMKKLKAFLHLLNIDKPAKKQIRIGAKMKALNRLSGNVRNIELFQQRIQCIISEDKPEAPKAYLQMLVLEKEQAMEQIQAMAKHFPFDTFKKGILKGAPQKLDDESIKSYLMQQRHALVSMLFQPIYSDEALHGIRKQVKEIGYNRNYLGTQLSLLLPIDFISKKQTDMLSEKLGSYNDICVSLSFLQPRYLRYSRQAELNVLQCIKRKIEDSKQQTRVDITQQLAAILKGAY